MTNCWLVLPVINCTIFVLFQFRRILEQGNRDITARCAKCPPDCADTCTAHPIQQGEVSSTEPPLPDSSVNGFLPEVSAYFEAVEHYISSVGWVLVQINSEGLIECVTENIKELIRYTRGELYKQSIYSYLHPGDHGKLSPILNNMSFTLGWEQDDGQQSTSTSKRQQKSRIRMLVKPPETSTETMEQKQQRQDKYEEVVIMAAPVKGTVFCLFSFL